MNTRHKKQRICTIKLGKLCVLPTKRLHIMQIFYGNRVLALPYLRQKHASDKCKFTREKVIIAKWEKCLQEYIHLSNRLQTFCHYGKSSRVRPDANVL